MALSKRKVNFILVIAGLFTILINQPLLEEGFQRTVRGLFVSYSLITIIIIWSISSLESIRDKNSRRVFNAIVAMLILWLLLRAIKYEVWDDTVNIYTWYLFYTPQTFLPLLVFYMTLYIDGSKKIKSARLLFIPATLISLGILTNNLHQLAFKFADGVISDDSKYSYGPIYYLSWIWMAFFMIAAIVNATIKSRVQKKRWATHWLVIWLLVPIIYILYYQFGPFFTRTYIFNFPEAFCYIYIIFLEICMGYGLIVSNRYHSEIFSDASIMAEITDGALNTVQRTSLCEILTVQEKQSVLDLSDRTGEKKQIIRKGYELNTTEIPGGYVFWLNDIKDLLNTNKGLKNLGEELSEENNILEAEIAITEQKASLEEQNRIYDSINAAISDKQHKLLELLDDKSQLKKALILAVYLKRKSNLLILSRQEEKTDIRELGLCINESFSYLRLNGCACNCTVIGNGSVGANVLWTVYDAFEEVLEQSFEGMNACLAFLKIEKEAVSLRLLVDHNKEEFIDESEMVAFCSNLGIEFSLDRQEDGVYLTFYAKEVAHA